MLTLMQLLKQNIDPRFLLEWCQIIAEDANEIYAFNDVLFDDFGFELSEPQLERLSMVCQNGKYKSAFAVAEILKEDSEE